MPTGTYAVRIATVTLLGLTPIQSHAAALTLDDAVKLALATSPTVRAAQAQLDGAEASTRAARGARVPTLSLSGQGGHNEGLAASADAITTQQQQQIAAQAQVSVLTDVGTSVGVGVSSGVSWRATNLDPSQSRIFELGPLYSSALTLDVRQPLLRGAGTEGALGAIEEAETRALAARRALQDTISQLALDVGSAHRELWYSQQALRIADEAVALAQEQAEQSELRFSELGSVSRTEVLRFNSERASARRARASAVAEAARRALDLGRLLNIEPAPAQALVAETSTRTPSAPNTLSRLEAAALTRSSRLLQRRADVSAAAVRLRTAANAAKVKVDLFAQAQASLLYDTDSLRAFDLPQDRPALSALIGLEVELPIGTSQQAGARDAARAAHQVALATYDVTAREIVSRVATQRAALVAATERITLAHEEALAAGELAEAERQKVLLGTGTAFEVLQAQQAQRDSRLLFLRAQLDYAGAEAQLAHDTGALLEALPRQTPLERGNS